MMKLERRLGSAPLLLLLLQKEKMEKMEEARADETDSDRQR